MMGGTANQVHCSPGAKVCPMVLSEAIRWRPSLEFTREPNHGGWEGVHSFQQRLQTRLVIHCCS